MSETPSPPAWWCSCWSSGDPRERIRLGPIATREAVEAACRHARKQKWRRVYIWSRPVPVDETQPSIVQHFDEWLAKHADVTAGGQTE